MFVRSFVQWNYILVYIGIYIYIHTMHNIHTYAFIDVSYLPLAPTQSPYCWDSSSSIAFEFVELPICQFEFISCSTIFEDYTIALLRAFLFPILSIGSCDNLPLLLYRYISYIWYILCLCLFQLIGMRRALYSYIFPPTQANTKLELTRSN